MKKILLTAIIVISLVVTLSFISAEFWACAEQGQVIDYCKINKPSRTCASSGGCQYCMSIYNATADCYVHGVWPKCNQIPQVCSNVGGNTTIDSNPPELTINNPTEGEIFNSKSVLLDLEMDEKGNIHYMDLINGQGRWTSVCTNCFGYDRTRSFKEGLNDLRFRAVDVVGNTAYTNISFFVDSVKPRVLKVEPKNGLTNGDFHIEFREENPVDLLITYGDVNPGIRIHEVDIDNECQLQTNGKYHCDTNIDLTDYEGKEIQYWVNITDIANNQPSPRKPNKLDVDTTLPVITNLSTIIKGKQASLTLNVTETNFDEALYSYIDDKGRLREGTFCSTLKNGACTKKFNLKTGHYDISVQVLDEAGSSVGQVSGFDIL